MLPDRVSNLGPLTYESGALPIALRGPAKGPFTLYTKSDCRCAGWSETLLSAYALCSLLHFATHFVILSGPSCSKHG